MPCYQGTDMISQLRTGQR